MKERGKDIKNRFYLIKKGRVKASEKRIKQRGKTDRAKNKNNQSKKKKRSKKSIKIAPTKAKHLIIFNPFLVRQAQAPYIWLNSPSIKHLS